MKVVFAALVFFSSITAFSISPEEVLSQSELVCSGKSLFIALNKSTQKVWHQDLDKEEGWTIEPINWKPNADNWSAKFKAILLVNGPVVTFPPVPLVFKAEVEIKDDGKEILMDYRFGTTTPNVEFKNLPCHAVKP